MSKSFKDIKTNRKEIRLSTTDHTKLEHCCIVLKLNKSEVVRKGIEEVFKSILYKG